MPKPWPTARTTSRALVEQCLARIADPNGEGARAFIKVHAEQARAMADAMDALRRVGREPSRYAGIPVSLKDLFDIAGEPTPAGSRVLADAPPATANAPVVQRMLAAGFVPMGRTNMTEFAFSGLGINPHYGTPRSPWDRAAGAHSRRQFLGHRGVGRRRHGGRRAGHRYRRLLPHSRRRSAASSATSRPRGACRSPACCRWRRASIRSGPLAPSVACCAVIDAVLAGETPALPVPASLNGLRLAVPDNVVLDGMDATVSSGVRPRAGRAVAAPARASCASRFAAFDAIGRGERQGRLRRVRGVCVAPRAARREGRGLRSAHPRAHRARRAA